MTDRPEPRRRCLVALAAALLLHGCASAPSRRPTAPAAAPAPVVVIIVIDQFAAWIADERLPLLPADGGFARLRREGTWAKDMRFAHANTETAPGHASLYTGELPRRHGIYSNEIPGAEDDSVAIVRDPDTRLVSAAGTTPRAGASLGRLRVETLADRLRQERPGAAIVGVSLKDRGTVFASGRRPNTALWFDHTHDVFVTSTAFAERYPEWAAGLTSASALAARRATPWTPLPGGLAEHQSMPDDAPGEGLYQGLDRALPHDFASAQKVGPAFRLAPASDSLLLDLALAAIDAERRPGEPMLLALSLSAHDYVGHVFGPDSREAWDELERLDRELGRFMAGLDARLGPAGWSLVLSADHGTSSIPEVSPSHPWCANKTRDRWQRPCAGGRLDDRPFKDALREVAASTLGPGEWVDGVEGSWVFLSEAAQRLPSDLRADLVEALIERLEVEPGVEDVIELDKLGPDCLYPGAEESIAALVCNGAVRDDRAALYTVLSPGWVFFVRLSPGHGASHGSTWLHDRSVPLLVRAPGRVAAGAVIEEPLSFASFSRTAAALLGISAPGSVPGRDLTAAPAGMGVETVSARVRGVP